jgi:hypothetical protein
MVTARLFPAGIVTGSFNPTMANSELADRSDEIVTAAFAAVSVACKLAVDATVTFPKFSVAGVTPSSGLLGMKPNPRTLRLRGDFGSLLTSVMMPWL